METSDIFTTITSYKKSENRFTASLVYLLRHLWKVSKDNKARRSIYCDFLNNLCGDKQINWGEQIIFGIQKSEKEDENGEEGILDFEISSPDNTLVGVEVKDTAPLELDKLKQYKKSLKRRAKEEGYKQNKLVLLRHHFISNNDTKDADNDIRWCELYVLLRDMVGKRIFNEDSASYLLLNEFLKHMEQKGVPPVEKISIEHLKGFQSLLSLLTLVRKEAESILGKELNLKLSDTEFGHVSEEEGEFDYVSFYFCKGRSKSIGYYIEVYSPYYTEPQSNSFSIGLKTRSEWVKEIEGKRLEVPPDSDDFSTDNEGFTYVTKPLDSVFNKKTLGEQSDMIGELLQEMYGQLNTIKRPISTRAKSRR